MWLFCKIQNTVMVGDSLTDYKTARNAKVPIIIAVGKKEVSDRTVSIRRLGSDDTSVVSLEDFTSSILQESLAPNK